MLQKVATQTWRSDIKTQQNALEAAFFQHKNPAQLLKKHSQLIDNLLKNIWLQSNIDAAVCLIAVGGYGRNELFPYSDIDLLILLPPRFSEVQNQTIEVLIGLLWDIGLNIGHSVRTLDECVSEAARDVTVQTNLLESRLLAGNAAHYQKFTQKILALMQPEQFFAAKFKEQDNRHAKFNDTAYSLEPNIKESPGGLRDLHMILWLAQSLNLGKNWAQLAKKDLNGRNMITPAELRQIKRHEKNLQTLRIRLHYLAKRREDRLLFDFQNELATDLGLANTPHKRASEQLMQSYYRSVKFISLINEILLKTLESTLTKKPVETCPINTRFVARNGLLETKTARTLQQHPAAILESFLLLQQHPELTGMSAHLLRELQHVKKSVNKDFRDSTENKQLFLSILLQPDGVNHSLRRMNRYGILGQYIPAFGKIVGQMQHDLFHVYTVDEHILNVLANLRRFAKPELKHEFPLCSQLFADFKKPHLLYLAALFHDIAKGRGGDHSTLGTLDAKRFCRLHNLPKEDTSLVAWLVQSHLKMSSTAQKSDLSDPAVIQQFAQFVKTETRLQALYLLTVADIRGTSPIVWNAWKARLLESLYHLTLHALHAKSSDTQTQIELRKADASNKLAKFGIQDSSIQPLWQQFGDAYFARFDSDEIAWQSRLLLPHSVTQQAIVRARLSPNGDGVQVMIYAKDRFDIFARICNFFDQMHYNIAQAKIFTTLHGYALDNFIVLEQQTKTISYSGLLKHIETELGKKLEANVPLEAPLAGRVSRQVKHMPIKTEINISSEPNSKNHYLEIVANDRPGLLASLARQFLQRNIALHNAKINTLGNRAEDSFLISAQNGEKLSESAIEQLTLALAAV